MASTVDAAVATWTANPEPDVTGYKLSYGTQSGVHTVVIDVGKVTTYTFHPPAGARYYYVVVQAYDASGQLSDKSAEVVLEVAAANLPPTVSQPASQTNTVNTMVSFAFSASDPEGKSLTFSATGLPPGLSMSNTSAMITGSPSTGGVYQVTVRVSDGTLTTNRVFAWTITNAGTPTPASAPGSAPGGAPGSAPGAGSIGSGTITLAPGTADASAPSPETGSVSTGGAVARMESSAEAQSVETSGDFDGDGRADLATYEAGVWRIWTASSNFLEATVVTWGDADDVPVPADYDGDRVTDLALYRPSTGTWRVWFPKTQTPLRVRWGGPGDRPLAIDYDGDGKADLAVARDGTHRILLSSSNYTVSVTVR